MCASLMACTLVVAIVAIVVIGVFVVVVVVVIIVFVGGLGVVLVALGCHCCPWCRGSCLCHCPCDVRVIVSCFSVAAVPANLLRYSKYWCFVCVMVRLMLCLFCACFAWLCVHV